MFSADFFYFLIGTIQTTATHAGLIFSLEPVFAALFGYLFLGEVLSVKGYIGAALVLFGILYAEMPRKHVRRYAPSVEQKS
ncbi:EamA family transporter [Anoxybacillus flavithermus]|uniref:EamA family transporter n=1 Tax=Anoxybacillus flavithermus TaxID=33934 RepID=UPI003BAA1F3F